MRSSIKALLGITAAAALAATAASSLAQEGPPQGGRPDRAGPRAGGPPNPQMREQTMRERLALRPDQETAFQAFLQSTRPAGGPGARGERREIRQMTTPERLDRQLAELRQRVDATKRFYAALSPDQRATFDSMPGAIGGQDGPGRGGRRAQGGPGGPGQGFGGPPPQ